MTKSNFLLLLEIREHMSLIQNRLQNVMTTCKRIYRTPNLPTSAITFRNALVEYALQTSGRPTPDSYPFPIGNSTGPGTEQFQERRTVDTSRLRVPRPQPSPNKCRRAPPIPQINHTLSDNRLPSTPSSSIGNTARYKPGRATCHRATNSLRRDPWYLSVKGVATKF